MRAKIFSVISDEDFHVLYASDETGSMSADEYLERAMQRFLDEHPQLVVTQLQYAVTPITPRVASNSTNASVAWEIEKSVILLYEEAPE